VVSIESPSEQRLNHDPNETRDDDHKDETQEDLARTCRWCFPRKSFDVFAMAHGSHAISSGAMGVVKLERSVPTKSLFRRSYKWIGAMT
jgi:hypothetical protein